MIVDARKKRDRHLILMEKANERVRKKTLNHGTLQALVQDINDEKNVKLKPKTSKATSKKDSGKTDRISEPTESGTPKAVTTKASFGFG